MAPFNFESNIAYSIDNLTEEEFKKILAYIKTEFDPLVFEGNYGPASFNINSDGLFVGFSKELVVDATKNYYIYDFETKDLKATLPLSGAWIRPEEGIMISAGINMNLRQGRTYTVIVDKGAIRDTEGNEHILGMGEAQFITQGTAFTYFLLPGNGSTVPAGTNITFQANQPIFPGTGMMLIQNSTNGQSTAISATDSRLTFAGNEVTFSPVLFAEAGSYQISIQETFLTIEQEGNRISPWYGMENEEWNLTIEAVPLSVSLQPANGSTDLNQQGLQATLNFSLPVSPQAGRNLLVNGNALPFGDNRLIWSNPDPSGQAFSMLTINFDFEPGTSYEITTDPDFARGGGQAFQLVAGEFSFSTAAILPVGPLLEDLPGMQLFGFDLVNDNFTPVGNTPSLQFFDQDQMTLPSSQTSISQIFERTDGFRIKAVMVGDSPATATIDARIERVADAALANLFRSESGKVIRFKMAGGDEGGDWRFPQRVVIGINNDRQPAHIGFPSENPNYSDRANYTPIYLKPGVMVGSGAMWLESYAEFPAKMANGLGPGTPDEFGVGINDFQFKRGLNEPIFPENEKSPFLFSYVTNDGDGDLAWQTRFYTYDGTNPQRRTDRIYQKIDQSKVYLRCFIVLGHSGSRYNKGRGYIWNIDLNAVSTAELIAQIETLATAALPDPNDSMMDVHLDEFLTQGAGGAEEDEIMGVPQPNNYAKSYQTGSGRVQQMAVNNGGNLPEMNKLRHPYQQFFLFRNDQISTETEAAQISEKEIFRMLLKQFKPKLA